MQLELFPIHKNLAIVDTISPEDRPRDVGAPWPKQACHTEDLTVSRFDRDISQPAPAAETVDTEKRSGLRFCFMKFEAGRPFFLQFLTLFAKHHANEIDPLESGDVTGADELPVAQD